MKNLHKPGTQRPPQMLNLRTHRQRPRLVASLAVIPQGTRGFVLIELMVVVAVLGILYSVLVPAYQQYVLAGYRREACAELLKLANLQQLLLVEQSRYSDDLSEFGFAGASYTMDSGRFVLSAELTGQGYLLVAEAVGAQLMDAACQRFQLDQYGIRQSMPEPDCWSS